MVPASSLPKAEKIKRIEALLKNRGARKANAFKTEIWQESAGIFSFDEGGRRMSAQEFEQYCAAAPDHLLVVHGIGCSTAIGNSEDSVDMVRYLAAYNQVIPSMDRLTVGPLFLANYYSKAKVNVNAGGTSSGKTYNILEVLATKAIEEPGVIITVVGQDIPNLKKGALRDMQHIMRDNERLSRHVESYNKSDRIYQFKNGSIIEFNSYADEQDAKSGKRDYLFVNEANGIDYAIYWQLFIRTKKQTFIDYNPSSAFWCHQKLIDKADVAFFISDHRHNPFLSQELHDEIENIEDEEYFKVYARGLTGQIKGLIYPKYQLCKGMPAKVRTVYGLDFGYNHKTALVEVGIEDNRLYMHELVYLSELTIGDLIQAMKDLNIGSKIIYCDHAAPDKIEDLRRAGFNALPANKEVKNGIDFVKRHQLYITDESTGLRKEVVRYKWKEDKKTGMPLDEPIKLNDDALDAARYAAYTGFRKQGVKVHAWGDMDDIFSEDYSSSYNDLDRRIDEAFGLKEARDPLDELTVVLEETHAISRHLSKALKTCQHIWLYC